MKIMRSAIVCSALLLGSIAPHCTAMEFQVIQPDEQTDANQAVVHSLQNLLQALAAKDLTQIANCLSDQVALFDGATNNVIYGKEAVMNHIKKNVLGTKGDATKKIVVNNPYVTIKKDTAMVSFQATKELAGARPETLESWCSEVFERSGDDWKVIYFRSNWKPVRVSTTKS
jgi:ketosteroid isomerase-like protein